MGLVIKQVVLVLGEPKILVTGCQSCPTAYVLHFVTNCQRQCWPYHDGSVC